MKCLNKLCVFQENNSCSKASEIEITWQGLCKNMIPVRLTSETMSLNKLYTKTILKSNDYHFDEKSGNFNLVDE